MARTRYLKPQFFVNEPLTDMSPLNRLLFAGLWCFADREGRIIDRPRVIKVQILPFDDCDVDAMLGELDAAGLIQRYEAGGERCIQITKFRKHQSPHKNEAPSAIPAPPGHPEIRRVSAASSNAPSDSSNSLSESSNVSNRSIPNGEWGMGNGERGNRHGELVTTNSDARARTREAPPPSSRVREENDGPAELDHPVYGGGGGDPWIGDDTFTQIAAIVDVRRDVLAERALYETLHLYAERTDLGYQAHQWAAKIGAQRSTPGKRAASFAEWMARVVKQERRERLQVVNDGSSAPPAPPSRPKLIKFEPGELELWEERNRLAVEEATRRADAAAGHSA